MQNVSVIIPAFNKAELTVKTIESVLKQTYPRIEIIVVDDGSKDRTQELVVACAGVTYIYQKNAGACAARNRGIRESGGELIAFLDCDDLYMPEKISHCAEFLKHNPCFGFVHTAASFIDADDHVTGHYSHPRSRKQGWIAQCLALGNFICNSTVVVRREALQCAGFFNENIFTPGDWDMWLRLSETAQCGYIDEPLTQYRITDNYIFNKFELARTEEEKVLTAFFDRHPESNGRLRSRAWSNFYLRFAQGYLVKDDQLQYRAMLDKAFKAWPFNLKLWVMITWSVLSVDTLKADLTRRILRR